MNAPEHPPRPSNEITGWSAPAPSVNGIEPVGMAWTGGKMVANSLFLNTTFQTLCTVQTLFCGYNASSVTFDYLCNISCGYNIQC